jgi:predicted SAM-dependent methyltransferase
MTPQAGTVATNATERRGPGHPEGIRKVNVGSGPNNLLADWWNVDLRPFEGIDQVMDAGETWPWNDRLEFVYGEHFLEHLSVPQALRFLVHAGNALAPGGRIRLSTPSLEWVLTTHFDLAPQDPARRRLQTWGINRAFHGWGHQFLYSREMLLHFIVGAGFESPMIFDYGRSNTPALINLERHGGWDVAGHYPSVWIVEAMRGEKPIALSGELETEAESSYVTYVRSGH